MRVTKTGYWFQHKYDVGEEWCDKWGWERFNMLDLFDLYDDKDQEIKDKYFLEKDQWRLVKVKVTIEAV